MTKLSKEDILLAGKAYAILMERLEVAKEHPDKDGGEPKRTWKYKDGHSDETVAKELNTTEAKIADIRLGQFGTITRGGLSAYNTMRDKVEELERNEKLQDQKLLTMARTIIDLNDVVKSQDRRIAALEDEVTKPKKPVQQVLPLSLGNGTHTTGR